MTITSEGAAADFKLTSDNPAVRISPTQGVTPNDRKSSADPGAFQSAKGTTAVTIKIESSRAVKQSPDPCARKLSRTDQRGTVIGIPGKLVDLVADPERDRFFILRQDKNEVLVFDGSTNTRRPPCARTTRRPRWRSRSTAAGCSSVMRTRIT